MSNYLNISNLCLFFIVYYEFFGLRKQFDLEISGFSNDNRRYKGYFYKDDLKEALDLVFKPMGYDYKLDGQQVVVK